MNITQEQLKEIIKEGIKEGIREASKKEEKLTLTPDEAVALSGIGKNKIGELMHKENTDFPYFKIGVKYLINREMFILWLEKISKEGRVL
jgi:hypothetical protein